MQTVHVLTYCRKYFSKYCVVVFFSPLDFLTSLWLSCWLQRKFLFLWSEMPLLREFIGQRPVVVTGWTVRGRTWETDVGKWLEKSNAPSHETFLLDAGETQVILRTETLSLEYFDTDTDWWSKMIKKSLTKQQQNWTLEPWSYDAIDFSPGFMWSSQLITQKLTL